MIAARGPGSRGVLPSRSVTTCRVSSRKSINSRYRQTPLCSTGGVIAAVAHATDSLQTVGIDAGIRRK